LLKGRVIADFYKISDMVYIAIVEVNGSLFYEPVEPVLTGREALVYSQVREMMPRIIYSSLADVRSNVEALKSSLGKALDVLLNILGEKLTQESKRKILYYLERDLVGYGPIDPMYNDPFVEDITCSGYGSPVYVYHRYYEWLPTNVYFTSGEELTNFVRRLAFRAGQELVYATPIVEGPLPPKDFRAHLTLDVVSRRGSTFTIRKSAEEPLTMVELIRLGTITREAAAYLWLLVSYRSTILVGGPMASGKTTLLNAISHFIPPRLKVVTIEETPELKLHHSNWTPLITKPSTTEGIKEVTLYDLLKSSLRQRADYIIVGEIRGEEAYTLLQAVATGHGGMSTIHAESFEHLIRRLQSHPMNIPKPLHSLIDTVVMIKRLKRGEVFERKVTEIVDIIDYDPVTDTLNSVKTYTLDLATGQHFISPSAGSLIKISKRAGVSERELLEEYNNRLVVLEYMEREGLTTLAKMRPILEEYYVNPARVVERAKSVAGG